ncbi:MAG TPA: DUF732 domain-containing protein [Mycobacterium sp.]|nr:DUF732 domain-containing protein [Mycobacterium sp.]
MIGKILVGVAGAVTAIGLAAPAGADPDPVTTVGTGGAPNPSVPGFLAEARAGGVVGTDPAMLEDGYSVCRKLWVRQMDASQVAKGLVQDHPQLTWDEAGHFVLAAAHDLCPTPGGFDGGTYDYWAYGTGDSAGGGAGGG